MSKSTTIGIVRRQALVALAILAAALYAGCGGEEGGGSAPSVSNAPLSTYVGEVALAGPESDPAPQDQGQLPDRAHIAVISDGDRISGFVTDGRSQAKWFATNELEDGTAELVARDGASLGEVTISDDAASGEVTLGLATSNFEAEPATGNAGLFSAAEAAEDDSFEAGWIVLGSGSELGSYDTFLGGDFKTQPAPKLAPTVNIPGFGAQAPAQLNTLFFDSNVQAP